MFVLVTGGSGSGKSAYAEGRIQDFNDPNRYYIATMMCFDEESKRRVERHRKMRAGKGFETIERFLDLKGLELPMPKETGVSCLLECMSNLTANEYFDPAGSGKHAADQIMDGICRLKENCSNLVVVTNEVFSDGIEYDKTTMEYLKLLGSVNCRMAELADQVVEVIYGIPQFKKR